MALSTSGAVQEEDDEEEEEAGVRTLTLPSIVLALTFAAVLGQEETGFTAADFATASPRPLAEAVRSYSALPCQHLPPWRSRY